MLNMDPLHRPSWRGRTNVDQITIAAIEYAESLRRNRGELFHVTQGSYQNGGGEELSAGTHDGGGAVDLRWTGDDHDIWCLRKAGFAAWHRTPAQGPWPDHIHAVLVDHPRLAPSAARQVEAYRAGRNGLANNGPDDGPRITPIPVFEWPQEDPMADYAKQLAGMDRKLDRLLSREERDRNRHKRILARLDALADEVADDATKGQIRRLRAELAAEVDADAEA